MLLRMMALAALSVGLFGLTGSQVASQEKDEKKPSPADQAKAKKALQEVQDFIGLWNLEGTQKEGNKTVAWKEKVSWSWKFKDGDASITTDFAEGKGKYFTKGELRYDVAKKKYLLTLTGTDKNEQVFEGKRDHRPLADSQFGRHAHGPWAEPRRGTGAGVPGGGWGEGGVRLLERGSRTGARRAHDPGCGLAHEGKRA